MSALRIAIACRVEAIDKGRGGRVVKFENPEEQDEDFGEETVEPTEPESDSELEEQANTTSETDMASNSEPETKADTSSEPESQLEPEADTELEQEAEPEANAELQPNEDEKHEPINVKTLLARNKKAVLAVILVVIVIAVAALAKYLIIPYATYTDAKAKLENGEYAAAAERFGEVPSFMDADEQKAISEKADYYTRGASALAAGNYQDAIKCFSLADDYQDATEQLENAKTQRTYAEAESQRDAGNYGAAGDAYASLGDYMDAKEKAAQCADNLMDSEDYSTAKGIYEKLGSNYAEKVTQAEAAHNNLQNMKSAESKITSGDFGAALELYNQVPDEFNHDGKNAGTRKQQLNSAIAVAGIVGTYSATGCNVSVTQTHRSTGSWHNWYLDDANGIKGMTVRVTESMADDGTITFKGKVSWWRYSNYSTVSSLVKSRNMSQEFTCDANPGTIQLDDDTTLSYDGSWHLRYKMVDYSEDVYFYYTYVANFDYSK